MADSMMPPVGTAATVRHEVSDDDLAQTLGTGDVPVLASSRLLTWAEQATRAAVETELDATSTSVGTGLQLEHLRPSPLHTSVSVCAELVARDGTGLVFQIQAEHQDGVLIARGEITRMVLDRQRFLQGLSAPG